jgi:hypothetical protein
MKIAIYGHFFKNLINTVISRLQPIPIIISFDFNHFLHEAEIQLLFSFFSKGANYD